MHRLFVAIRPPREIRAQLLAIMRGVEDARWQDDDQLHLTLRFIGEVERTRAEDIAAALASVRQPPFELRLNGVGMFDTGGRRGNLWVGVEPPNAPKVLRDRVNGAMRRAGFAPEKRKFVPHITIARLRSSSGPIEGFIAANGGFASTPFTVSEFNLYESHLHHSGARYEAIQRYPLSR